MCVCYRARLFTLSDFVAYLLSSMKNSEREQRGKNRPIKKKKEDRDEKRKEKKKKMTMEAMAQ